MAVADAYASAGQYRAEINKPDTGSDGQIDRDLLAVSRYVEKELGRFFTCDEKDVARDFIVSYTGNINPEAENPWKYLRRGEPRLIEINDLSADPTSVEADYDGDGVPDTEFVKDTDFVLYPINADKGPEPKPWMALWIPPWSTTQLLWPPGRIVRITAKWGWPAVPQAIRHAVIELTAILRLETPRASRDISPTGEVLGTSREARGIVADLMRHYARN